ncbi:MAG: phosphoheptose isomerase [Verrucomicrobia bacterium]|nr:phosphoheptose isomerase [Verrucomicrobiota bacterium]
MQQIKRDGGFPPGEEMNKARNKRIVGGIRTCSAVIAGLERRGADIAAVSDLVVKALKAGRKILTAGNGGSAAEALHMSEELVGRFRNNRISLPAVSLVADTTALTCIGNDFGFDCLFSRQVEGLGQAGDVLVLFSTSGRARNLLLALEAARKKRMKAVCLLGKGGGPLAGKGDCEVLVESDETERIQEAHQLILHLVLDEVETEFWSKGTACRRGKLK